MHYQFTNPTRKNANSLGLQSAFASLDKQLESLLSGFPLIVELEKKVAGDKDATKRLRGRWTENEAGYQVSFDVPGVKKSDIGIETEDGVVTVTAKRVFANPGADDETLRYEAKFELPEGTDLEKLSASYDAGVLTLILPKGEKAKPRRIEIAGE